MSTILNMSDANGNQHIFMGNHGTGMLYSSDVIPESLQSDLVGQTLGQRVLIQHPGGNWLESTIIVSVNSDSGGTTFQLAY
jgi:hypothetical protein